MRETTSLAQPSPPPSQSSSTLSESKTKSKSILKQVNTNQIPTKRPAHGRIDSVSGDQKPSVELKKNDNSASASVITAASSHPSQPSRREGSSRSWRRKLDPEVLAELRYACYALDALIQTGQPAAPAVINAAVEAASAPKSSHRKRVEVKSSSNHSIPVQQPPTTAAHRSRAVSNPSAPRNEELPPVPTAHHVVSRPQMPPSGVRLLSSAFSQAEERRASAGEENPLSATIVELPGHEVSLKPLPLNFGRQALRIVPTEEKNTGAESDSPSSAHTAPTQSNTRTEAQVRRVASSAEGITGISRKPARPPRPDESAHPGNLPELSDESYSTPRSVSDRAASTARTSLPVTPSGKSAVNVGLSPSKKVQQSSGQDTSLDPKISGPRTASRTSNRHSRRPSSKIVIPPTKVFNIQVTQPAESPATPVPAQKHTLRSISSQIFRLRGKKSQKNLVDPVANPPLTTDSNTSGGGWKQTISGLRSRTSRLSLRDYPANADSSSSTQPRRSNEAKLPPMPSLGNLAKYGQTSQAEPPSRPVHPKRDSSLNRPQTSHGKSGPSSHEVTAVPTLDSASRNLAPPDKSFRPLSTIKNNLRKSRSSIFLRNAPAPASTQSQATATSTTTTTTAEPTGTRLEEATLADVTMPQTNASAGPGKLRKMLSILQFSNPNKQRVSPLTGENAPKGHDVEMTTAADAPNVRY